MSQDFEMRVVYEVNYVVPSSCKEVIDAQDIMTVIEQSLA